MVSTQSAPLNFSHYPFVNNPKGQPLIALIVSAFTLCIFAYLMGSVSTAIIVCKIMGYPDPRSEGSNNPGATNVLRIGGKFPAILTLLGDVLKGVFAVLIGQWLDVTPHTLALIGFSAFFGHLFPLYFNFEGGKGVATALGVVTTMHWPLGAAIIGIWFLTALIFRISSLAALVSWAAAPLLTYFLCDQYLLGVTAMTGFLILRHKKNIKGIIDGTESRIGEKKTS